MLRTPILLATLRPRVQSLHSFYMFIGYQICNKCMQWKSVSEWQINEGRRRLKRTTCHKQQRVKSLRLSFVYIIYLSISHVIGCKNTIILVKDNHILMKIVFFTLFITILVVARSETPLTNSTIVEISPSALEVLLQPFEQLIVYFHNHTLAAELEQALLTLSQAQAIIKAKYPLDHILFGYVNRTSDFKSSLGRFGSQNGFFVLNSLQVFKQQAGSDLVEFYEQRAHPQLLLLQAEQFRKLGKSRNQRSFSLVFQFVNNQQLQHYNKIFQKIEYFLDRFVPPVRCYGIPVDRKLKEEVKLFEGYQIIGTFNTFNRTVKEAADEIVQQVSVDTLPTVTKLSDSTFDRVFGGSVQDQILLIYDPSNPPQHLNQIKTVFSDAAHHNRNNHLAYERVLFTIVEKEFFQQTFNEVFQQIAAKQQQKYVIYFTRTDYDRFQVQKYILRTESAPSMFEILGFIEDVRLKKLQPEYKSQQVPTQQQQNDTFRKIVGKSFISQIYEKSDQSILVLFIDSKDPEAHGQLYQLLRDFEKEYIGKLSGQLQMGIFDLAKNEHKLLYLKQAPQLIFFDRANKKQSKYVKLPPSPTPQHLLKELQRLSVSLQLQQL